MKLEDVPQDAAILDRWQEIAYAIDENGNYSLIPSSGWEPANLANIQAWEIIREELDEALELIHSGKASPLYFHMVLNQMDAGLLARYAEIGRWRVKRHLRPVGYAGLKQELKQRYASLFNITPEALDQVPQVPELPVPTISDQSKDQNR